ncbi:MAG: protein-glutamate O-methyltransferase [Planctomycetes bacterium]|nr:protein-glutamate O-methyltransferase [Planctomycetota bacterium]MCC7169973.1 protein-glutamate O-methyltransferase [Planctomycetota bacterium]
MSRPDARDHGRASQAQSPAPAELSRADYDRFAQLIHSRVGIKLGDNRMPMLQARLARRLRALGLTTFREYLKRVEALPVGDPEFTAFINAVTTNKTEFLREEHHFRYLADQWLTPLLAASPRAPTLRVWCSASSTGEEPYSIAITLMDALEHAGRSADLRILASDIDTDVLSRAREGVYDEERLQPLSPLQRHRWFAKQGAGLWRASDELRALITFKRLNLMDERWPIKSALDVVFCRNVMIYFDRDTQARIVRHFAHHMKPDGVLFLGHSETMMGADIPFRHIGRTVYQHAEPPEGRGEPRHETPSQVRGNGPLPGGDRQ